jgi:hypothetical protein
MRTVGWSTSMMRTVAVALAGSVEQLQSVVLRVRITVSVTSFRGSEKAHTWRVAVVVPAGTSMVPAPAL